MKKELLQKSEGIVSVLKRLFYMLSVRYPIFGIIAGFVLQTKQFSPEIKNIGRTCFWISVLLILVMGAIAVILSNSIPRGQ